MTDPDPDLSSFFPMGLAADTIPPEPSAEPLPLLAVYGDSFTSGYAGFGVGERNWTTIVARRLNLAVANNAIGGTGWVQCPGVMTFPGQVATYPQPGAALTVFFGSFNDRVTASSAAVGVAVRVTLRLTTLMNPTTKLLVVGPQWPGAGAPELMYAHRDAVRAEALAAGAQWVDPLDERWFTGLGLIWSGDAIHPTDEGHRFIADRITPHVAALLN